MWLTILPADAAVVTFVDASADALEAIGTAPILETRPARYGRRRRAYGRYAEGPAPRICACRCRHGGSRCLVGGALKTKAIWSENAGQEGPRNGISSVSRVRGCGSSSGTRRLEKGKPQSRTCCSGGNIPNLPLFLRCNWIALSRTKSSAEASIQSATPMGCPQPPNGTRVPAAAPGPEIISNIDRVRV